MRASTSVETWPGMISRILQPKATARDLNARAATSLSEALVPASSRAFISTPSTIGAYAGMVAAAAMSDGFVVESVGLNSLMELMSPVSETTVVMLRSCSRSVAMVAPLRRARQYPFYRKGAGSVGWVACLVGRAHLNKTRTGAAVAAIFVAIGPLNRAGLYGRTARRYSPHRI